jgi:Flp pilus assembly protein TadD/TolB-like protein
VFFKPRRSGRCLRIVLACGALGGCQQKIAGPAPLYAVVRFENLSGDASLEWLGRGASELLSSTLSGAMDGPVIAQSAIVRLSPTLGPRPGGAPGLSSERTAAQLAGATRVISGYVERTSAGLRLTSTQEDLGSGKVINTYTVADSSPLNALNGLARTYSAKAKPFQTSSEDALRLYSTAREGTPENAVTDLEQAVQADPHFGQAWEALIQLTLSRGDKQGAETLIAKAREQKLDPLAVATLDLDSAVLRGDQNGRLAALRQVSSLSAGDTVLRRSLAESESTAGQFPEAASDWRKLRDILPSDPDAWNQLGYTLAWSGDYAGAVSTMEGYARLRPNDPNPLDSLGDVHYLYRKYKEAAAAYQQAYSRSPGFQNGGDLYKAAWAKFMAGDKSGADTTFAQFRKVQEKNETFPVMSADWLYRTGRQKEAIAELRATVNTATPAIKPVILNQLALWELLSGDRTAAAKDAEAAGPPATPANLLIRFATFPSATAAEWNSRAQRMLSGPAAEGLRKLAVGYALILDGRKTEAIPVWKEISDSAPATDFDLRAVYTRVKGEQPRFALLPNPTNVNPFSAVLEKL